MNEPMSHLGTLLRSYGIGTRYSLRETAKLTGLSRQTLSDILKSPLADSANVRQQRKASLKKISVALNIPFDLLERAAMRDWGLIRTVRAETVHEVLSQLTGLDAEELALLQVEIGRMQADLASGRRIAPDRPTVPPALPEA